MGTRNTMGRKKRSLGPQRWGLSTSLSIAALLGLCHCGGPTEEEEYASSGGTREIAGVSACPSRCGYCSSGYPARASRHQVPKGTAIGWLHKMIVQNGKIYAQGWACVKGDRRSIPVHLYAGGPAGGANCGGAIIASGTANRPTASSVREACGLFGVGSSRHIFKIEVSASKLPQHGGKLLYAHAINNLSSNRNNLIDGSGTRRLPRAFALKAFAVGTDKDDGVIGPSGDIVGCSTCGGVAGGGAGIPPASTNARIEAALPGFDMLQAVFGWDPKRPDREMGVLLNEQVVGEVGHAFDHDYHMSEEALDDGRWGDANRHLDDVLHDIDVIEGTLLKSGTADGRALAQHLYRKSSATAGSTRRPRIIVSGRNIRVVDGSWRTQGRSESASGSVGAWTNLINLYGGYIPEPKGGDRVEWKTTLPAGITATVRLTWRNSYAGNVRSARINLACQRGNCRTVSDAEFNAERARATLKPYAVLGAMGYPVQRYSITLYNALADAEGRLANGPWTKLVSPWQRVNATTWGFPIPSHFRDASACQTFAFHWRNPGGRTSDVFRVSCGKGKCRTGICSW